MRWEDFRRSDNVEDRRGDAYGGGGGSMGGGTGNLGIGAIVILGLIGWALGIDPRLLIGGAEMLNGVRHGPQTSQSAPPQQRQTGAPSDQMGQFVAAVLAENEDVWTEILPAQKGIAFVKPTLVLYSGQTRSGCGGASAAMGPFYCPNDQKVYLDTAFFRDMKQRLGGGGDFAYAYVIAHEIGHHIQNQLGILPKVQAAQRRAVSRGQANAISVRAELMADCLAGVWAANAERKYQILQPGDIEKAVATAQAIGDDRLQKSAQGYAVPDSFTHGTSAQRQQWLNRGLKSGQVDSCNTFAQ
ncbi:KPN_02809 family neutral zinc metallopeptidase [Methylocapsa aurea]|uniref:KPN_02809 family neutral zinc metallopeptidase n=1 Tax=Methylocapsa aurea TaxID=663610 RepID=UPI00055E3DA6|nr:neutral zinc metallopeptidase [Methylocapsa aurea]